MVIACSISRGEQNSHLGCWAVTGSAYRTLAWRSPGENARLSRALPLYSIQDAPSPLASARSPCQLDCAPTPTFRPRPRWCLLTSARSSNWLSQQFPVRATKADLNKLNRIQKRAARMIQEDTTPVKNLITSQVMAKAGKSKVTKPTH